MPQGTLWQKRASASAVAAITICLALLILRSWFFIAWEESFFDSDQAVVGLMAKHLAEGRAWPLFFYGQEYMLAVESWVMAPFVGLFGASIVSLRLAMIAMNLAAGLLLMRLLVRDAGLGLWSAVLASAPFWIAPLATGSELLDAQGGNIEPFIWVLVLWMLRRRSLALGVCLGIAVLNREFSMYAVPMLVAADLVERHRSPRRLTLDWLSTAVAFLIVYSGVQWLKPHADLLGPGTAGTPLGAAGGSSLAVVMGRIHWNPSEWGVRLTDLWTDYVPTMFGLKRFNPSIVGIATDLRVGSHAMAPLVALLAGATIVLLALDRARHYRAQLWLFPVYLTGIGALAAIAYAVTRPLSIYTLRYGLLVLYGAVGIAALALQRVSPPRVRWTAAAALVLLTACSFIDHVRVLARATTVPPPTAMRDIIERLAARRVHVAFADYWRAYNITFLSGETIKVASTDFERIREYRTIANLPLDDISPGGTVIIQIDPCAMGGERVGRWYLCDRR